MRPIRLLQCAGLPEFLANSKYSSIRFNQNYTYPAYTIIHRMIGMDYIVKGQHILKWSQA